MQRRYNVFVPLACPHCRTELLLTLDQVQQESSIRCALCGTTIELRPQDLPMPGATTPPPADFYQA